MTGAKTMIIHYSLTHNLEQFLPDDHDYLDALAAWHTWPVEEDLPLAGQACLDDLLGAHSRQMRLIRKERGGWFCAAFSPDLYDYVGFSPAGDFLKENGQDFEKAHLANADLCLRERKPIYSVFSPGDRPNIAVWQVLYLPVRYPGSVGDEVIALMEPVLYRRFYLQELLHGENSGLMTIVCCPRDENEQKAFQIVKANRPLERMLNKSREPLDGLFLENVWDRSSLDKLIALAALVAEDGQTRHISLTMSDEILTVMISREPWGLAFQIWQKPETIKRDLAA